jgi:hypothetical protein
LKNFAERKVIIRKKTKKRTNEVIEIKSVREGISNACILVIENNNINPKIV